MQPEITVIICCYNNEARITRVLDRVYEQKNLGHYIKEVIIVDNHSTDHTKEKVIQYQNRKLSVPLNYMYEGTPGVSNARKAGIHACTTEWIAFIDSDNFIEPNWFYHAQSYISCNPNVGAFNGTVVPWIDYKLSVHQECNLKASLKVLACTHLNKGDVKRYKESPFRNPIGAGLIIKAKPLKKFMTEEGFQSAGRTADNLTSGEDGEMSFYVKKEGFQFGYCPHMLLQHELPKFRLEDEYLNRMWFEIGRGVAVVMKECKNWAVKDLLYRILINIRLCKYGITNKCQYHFYKKYKVGYICEIKR